MMMMARWHPMFGPCLLIVMMVTTAMALGVDTTPGKGDMNALLEESGAMTTVGSTADEKVPADAPAPDKTEAEAKPAAAATEMSHPMTTVASEVTTTKGNDSSNINSSMFLMVLCGLGAFLRVSA